MLLTVILETDINAASESFISLQLIASLSSEQRVWNQRQTGEKNTLGLTHPPFYN